MKKILSIIALTAALLFTTNNVNAQNISFSINIGSQPAWGPTGYDYVDYYYFPDFNGYYDINNGMFIYLDRGRWITARYLPAIYRHFDLYDVYKVALNIHKPWLYNKRHVNYYGRYRDYRGRQAVIRDSRDNRYHRSRTNYRPWSPERHDKYDYRPHNHKPNNNSGRPSVGSNRPNNRPNNSFDRPNTNNNRPSSRPNINNNNRPQNNKPDTNRPSYSRDNDKNNKNNSRPKSENTKVTSRPNSSSRPSYNSKNSRNNNSRSTNQSSRSRNSNNDSKRSTYFQTKY